MFRGVHSAIHAAVAALSYWVLQHLDQLQAYIADYKAYALPGMLAALGLLFRISDRLAKVTVEQIPFFSRLLRKVLSGKDDIEGDWPLVVMDMARLEPLYVGFLTIGYRDGQYSVSGDDWHLDGEHAQEFRSVQSLYRNRIMQYWYEQGASLHRPDMRGYTEIYFFPREGVPQRHAGKFLDPQHTSDIRFYARKQRYGFWERRMRTPETKLEAARKLLADIEPRIAVLQAREIAADFI